jgi:hypothetical protein
MKTIKQRKHFLQVQLNWQLEALKSCKPEHREIIESMISVLRRDLEAI